MIPNAEGRSGVSGLKSEVLSPKSQVSGPKPQVTSPKPQVTRLKFRGQNLRSKPVPQNNFIIANANRHKTRSNRGALLGLNIGHKGHKEHKVVFCELCVLCGQICFESIWMSKHTELEPVWIRKSLRLLSTTGSAED